MILKENQFLTDLNVVLESNISEITIETALMALDILDSILLNKLSLKKINSTLEYKTKISEFYLTLKKQIVDSRLQISRDFFLEIPLGELNTLDPKADKYTSAMAKDLNNFSCSMVLYVIKDMSYERAILKVNHLIDILGMAIEQKNFHDVWAISAALNNTAIQKLITQYKFSASRLRVLERMEILANEYDEFMNLRHVTFGAAIPTLSIYGGQVTKDELMSGKMGDSLFKPVLLGLQGIVKQEKTDKNVVAYPSPEFNKTDAIKELIHNAGGWEYIAAQIDDLPIPAYIKEDSKDVLEQVSSERILKELADIESDLISVQAEYHTGLEELSKEDSSKSLDDMKKEDGFDVYAKKYYEIRSRYNLSTLDLRNQIKRNPDDESLQKKWKEFQDNKKQEIELLNKATLNGARFHLVAKICELETTLRELNNNKISSRDNLDQTLNSCISAMSLLLRQSRPDRRKIMFLGGQHQHTQLNALEKIVKLLDPENTSTYKPCDMSYEKAIHKLHLLTRINYIEKGKSKKFRDIEKLVAAFGESGETKLGSRQELESLLERLLAKDLKTLEFVNQKLDMTLSFSPENLSKFSKLHELVFQQSTLKKVLRGLEFQFTIQGKIRYLSSLKQNEDNLSQKAWEQIALLKDSLKSGSPLLKQTVSYKKICYEDGFFHCALKPEAATSYHISPRVS